MATNLYNSAQTAATQGAQDMDAIFGEVATINNERAAALKSAASDQELVTSTKALSDAKQQRDALAYATKLGTNPDSSTEVLTQLISDKANLFNTARATLQKISATRNTSLFADPGAWLSGNLNLEKDTNNYNAAAEEYNLVGKRIDDVVSQTDDIVKMTKGIQISVTDASAEASARVASANLLEQSNQARVEALKSNAEGIIRTQALKQTALSNSVQQQQLGMEAQRLTLAKQSAALEQTKLAMVIDEKNENLQEKTRTIQAINLYRKTNGMPEITWTDLKLLYKDPEQKRLLDQQITGGLTTAQTGARYLADTPANALQISVSNGAQLAAGPQHLVSKANDMLGAIKAKAQSLGTKLTAQQGMDLLNSDMQKEATKELGNITGTNSLYVPPSLTTLLSDPNIQATPSAQLVLAPLATSGVKNFDASQVVPLIFEQVKQGKIPMERAIQDITFIAGKSVAYNNAHFSYDTTMGLPKMTSYNASLAASSPFSASLNTGINAARSGAKSVLDSIFSVTGAPISSDSIVNTVVGGNITSNTIIDLTNPAKVQDFANRYMASNISANLKQQAAANSNKTSPR